MVALLYLIVLLAYYNINLNPLDLQRSTPVKKNVSTLVIVLLIGVILGLVFSSRTSVTAQGPPNQNRPLSSVTHDATLTGDGTTSSPLGIADGGVAAPKLNTQTAPAAGQVLGFDGTNLAWQPPSAGANIVTFRHTRTPDNMCGPFDSYSLIDHPSINANADVFIFVTALVRTTSPSSSLQLVYTGGEGFGTCPAARWVVRGGDALDGAQYNVMVVNP
jgi:hypothetical protein